MSVVPYTFPLTADSGMWSYSPERDTVPSTGWNASYSGSSTWPSPGSAELGNGNIYFRTQAAGASFAANITGTGLILCVTDNGAVFSVRLDDQEPAGEVPNNQACIDLGASRTISFANQDLKSHRVEVNIANASSAHEFQFYGAVIETHVSLLSTEDSIKEKVIDDTDPGWYIYRKQGSAWDNSTDTLYHDSTISFTCNYGQSQDSQAAYTFSNASAIALTGEIRPGTRYYSVTLDGDEMLDSTDTTLWRVVGTTVFFHSGLDTTKQYTLRYRNWSDTHPDCTIEPDGNRRNCCRNFDSLTLIGSKIQWDDSNPPLMTQTFPSTSSTSPSPAFSNASSSSQTNPAASPTSPSQTASSVNRPSSNTVLVAGGTVGGFFGASILFIGLFFIRRHRKRDSTLPQHVADALPSVGEQPSSTDKQRPMSQLAPEPRAWSGFIDPELVLPSDRTGRYFPTASYGPTSTSSGSIRSLDTAGPFVTPWLVDTSGKLVNVDLDRGGTPSQSISSDRLSTDRPTKTALIVLGTEKSVETPPPYRD